jgi:hypothetical protein
VAQEVPAVIDHENTRPDRPTCDEPLVVPLWAGADNPDTPEVRITLQGGHVVLSVNRAMRNLARRALAINTTGPSAGEDRPGRNAGLAASDLFIGRQTADTSAPAHCD